VEARRPRARDELLFFERDAGFVDRAAGLVDRDAGFARVDSPRDAGFRGERRVPGELAPCEPVVPDSPRPGLSSR
jgi:hypothetical protein